MEKRQKSQLILDTNAIQYGCDGKYSEKLLEVLTLLNKEYEFAVSSITTYEFFAGLSGKRGTRMMQSGREFLTTLRNIPIENTHLRIAAALRTCYKCNDLTKGIEGGVSFPDGLIGATAVVLDAHILTGNSNDFPSPFFDEKRVFTLKPPTERQQKLSICAPDISYFKAEVNRVYKGK